MRNFTENHNAPPGSLVEMTPSAYMTTKTWRKIMPRVCEGIRQMEGIRDHPDWWVVLSLDGFESHLDPDALLDIFTEYNILVVKEEGDTSQVSQAYDQEVAKADKKWTRQLLDGYKFLSKRVIDQWQLILVANQALNEVSKTDAWRRSFIAVNMCPSCRKPFKQWKKR